MRKKKVKEFKPYDTPLIVRPSMIIEDMLKLFLEYPTKHHLCVVDDNDKLIGLISRKRIFQAVFSHHMAADSRLHELYALLTCETASDLLLRNIITISEEDDIDKVISLMIKENLFELPVTGKKGEVLGFLTSEMLLEAKMKDFPKESS
ncbi:MAG: HPP family protein [Candidatus Aminicenantales bacterium]